MPAGTAMEVKLEYECMNLWTVQSAAACNKQVIKVNSSLSQAVKAPGQCSVATF